LITSVDGTGVGVVTGDRSVHTPVKLITTILRTSVHIIAKYGICGTSCHLVTLISGAQIVVIALQRVLDTSIRGITGMNCTCIVVVTVENRAQTRPQLAGIPFRTSIPVITGNFQIQDGTANGLITVFCGTGIVIRGAFEGNTRLTQSAQTNISGCAGIPIRASQSVVGKVTSNLWQTQVISTGITIRTDHLITCTFSGQATVQVCAQVVVIALTSVVQWSEQTKTLARITQILHAICIQVR